MKENKYKEETNLKLWRYCCKKCNNQDRTVERAYYAPSTTKICPKCGNEMFPKEATINLNKGLKGIIKIKL